MASAGYQQNASTRLFEWLAYLGVAPFLLGIGLSVLEVSPLGIDGRLWFTGYSSVILSFLCGIWWGGALNGTAVEHRNTLMVLSNVIALVGWAALLFYQSVFALAVLVAMYLLVERLEAYLKPNRAGFTGYFTARTRVTWLVVACHLGMMLVALVG